MGLVQAFATLSSALYFASGAHGAAIAPMLIEQRDATNAHSGVATWYGEGAAQDLVSYGACSLMNYGLPGGVYGAALAERFWSGSAKCGGCVNVHHGDKTLTAMIVDRCPGCDAASNKDLDLFPDAFEYFAPKADGVIDISWEFAECPVQAPLEVDLLDGTNEWWFQAQVRNARRPTDQFEVSTDQGNVWQPTDRSQNNVFTLPGHLGQNSAWIRVTSDVGSSVVLKDVSVQAGVVPATENYA